MFSTSAGDSGRLVVWKALRIADFCRVILIDTGTP
jgi:hypothetical protein